MINNLIKFFLLKNTLFLKIILVFTLPALGMLYFSTVLVYEKINTIGEVDNIQKNIQYISITQKLVHSLQKERGYSAVFANTKNFREELYLQREKTDKEYKYYLKKVFKININENLTLNIKDLQDSFYEIDSLRKNVDSNTISPYEILNSYSDINEILLNSISSIRPVEYVSEVNDRISYIENLLLAKEYTAIERGLTSVILSNKKMTTAMYNKLLETYALQEFNLKQFKLKAQLDEINKLNSTFKFLDLKEISLIRKELSNGEVPSSISLHNWWDVSSSQINSLEKVYNFVSLRISKMAIALETNAYMSQIFSLTFLFISFLTLISLLFVLRNIISNEQRSYLKVEKQQDVYRLLNMTNKLLLKINNEKELFEKICKLISENPSMSFGFIYKKTKNNKFKLIAKESALKSILDKKLNDTNTGSTFLREVVLEEKNIIIKDFSKKNSSILSDVAVNYNLKSAAAFPIKKFDRVHAILFLYSNKAEFFDMEIEILFEKMINDMSHALEKIEYEKIRLNQENELRLASYAFESNEPMIITNSESVIINANNAFCKVMGYDKADVIGKKPNIFKSKHQSKNFYHQLWDELSKEGSWTGEIYNTKKNKEKIPLRSIITAIKDNDGKVINYLAQYSDISEQIDKQKVLEYQATHDNLTGLPNRLLLLDRIEHAITKVVRHNILGGLVFIDLDNFKMVNDTLGHEVGDNLLIMVAQKIRETIRDEDTIARIGGDEFIVLADCIGENKDEAKSNMMVLAQKVKDSLNSIDTIDGHKNISTPSIGVTLFSDASVSSKEIIKQADTAMYQAKKQGKNTIEFFT